MSSIFHGGNTYIFYNTDANNNIPTAIGYENIDYLGAFPQVKINSSNTTIETYDNEWTSVLAGNMSIDSVSIVVHYVPDNTSHQYLDSVFSSQTKFQIKVSMYESQDSLEQHYVILSGYISGSQDSAEQNEVYDRTYTFTAEDLIARGTATDPAPLKQGDFGIGADGETIPQYESDTPSGNSFIKVPALQTGNPLGIDMLGIAGVDDGGDQRTYVVLAETGSINLYAKNTSTGWTLIPSKTQTDAAYVPMARTINGKSLTTDITFSKSDIGLSSVSNDAQLKIASNLSDLADLPTARSNLSVYSKAEVNSTVSGINTTIGTLVPKTTTINGHALSNNVVVTAADVGLGAVLNAVQLVASSNLSDVANVSTARTNISAAKSGANSDITSITGLTTALSIAQGGTGNSTGNAPTATLAASATKLANAQSIIVNLSGNSSMNFDGTAGGGIGVTNTLGIANGGTGNTTGLAASATKLATARTVVTNLGSTTAGSFDGSANVTPGVTGTLPITNGGTGATTVESARTNIGLASTGAVTFGSFELFASTPYIDFHYNNTSSDYNVRLINNTSNVLSCSGVFDTAGGFMSRAGTGGTTDVNVPWNFFWNYNSNPSLSGFIGNTYLGYISFNTSSDIGLKKDVVYLESSALDEVKQWKPVTFKYKARGIIPESDTQYGFIANDLVAVSPDVVKGKGLPDDYNIEEDPNNPDAYSLDQIAMISKLTQAIQQQQVLIEALQQQINK